MSQASSIGPLAPVFQTSGTLTCARTSTASSGWNFAIPSVGLGGFVRDRQWRQLDELFMLALCELLSSALHSSSEVANPSLRWLIFKHFTANHLAMI